MQPLGEEPGDGGSDSCTHQMIKNLVLTLHGVISPGPAPYRPPPPASLFALYQVADSANEMHHFLLRWLVPGVFVKRLDRRWPFTPVSSVLQAESWQWPSLPSADPGGQSLFSLPLSLSTITPFCFFPSRPRSENCFPWWRITGSLNIPAEFLASSCLQTHPSPLPHPVFPFFFLINFYQDISCFTVLR